MGRRRDVDGEERPAREEVVKVTFSPVNEQVVLAACIVDPEARKRLTQTLRPENFLQEEHRPIWVALSEMERRGLAFDWQTLEQIGGGKFDLKYLRELHALRAEPPTPENLHHHVQAMAWDRQRAVAVQGPVSSLLEALKDPASAPERVRALARHVADSFSGAGKSYLREPAELVSSVMRGLEERLAGRACFPYGIEGLDFYEQGTRSQRGDDISGRHRMIPGARPGQVTVLTAANGGGKSTFAAHMALGLARQGRRVVYGAWEPGGEMTMEVLACLSLGFSRTDLSEGIYTREELVQIEERCHAISSWVTMQENPFRRQIAGKESNARNLDVVHQHIIDSGCEVFIADLWERCLVDDNPGEEKRALFRQQAMAVETNTHVILLAQQKTKGEIELRSDKRPTKEGIKGSSAWGDIGDTIIAPHRPAMYKKVDDNRLEAIIWKQRWGLAPMVVEFDWDPEFGSIENGRTIPFEHIGQEGDFAEFRRPEPQSGGRKRRSRA